MRVSIVTGMYNDGDNLWRTLTSCVVTLDGMDAEFAVTDDALTGGSIESLSERFPRIRTVAVYQGRMWQL